MKTPGLPELTNCQVLKTFASENTFLYMYNISTSSQLYFAHICTGTKKGVNLCRLPKAGRDVPLKDGLGHEWLLLDGLVDEGGGILQLSQLSLLSSESTIIYGYRALRKCKSGYKPKSSFVRTKFSSDIYKKNWNSNSKFYLFEVW